MVNERAALDKLKKLGKLMDSKFEGPFGFRFGFDGLIGLLPIVGDFATSGISLFIIYQAAMLGCSVPTLLRMILNVMIDNFLDVFPILGNILDFVWKANNKNMILLEKHLANPTHTHRQSLFVIGSLVTLLLLFFMMTAYLSYLVIQWIFQ